LITSKSWHGWSNME